MSTDIVFAAADKLRTLRDKNDFIDLLKSLLPANLAAKLEEWKSKDPDEIRDTLEDELVAKLRERLPEKFHFLFDRIDGVDDHLLDLIDVSKDDEHATGAVRVGASLSAAVEFDGVLDEDLRDVLEREIPPGSALFATSVSGRIGIHANASHGTPLVSLSAQFSSDHHQTLTVGFVREAGQPVLLELLRLRDYFVNPADLGAVMTAFADRSARLIRHQYQGTVVFGMQVGIERGLTSALGNLIGDERVEPAGKAELSLSVNFKDRDEFVLTVERDTESSAFVRLERKSSREKSRVFKLGASIEIKGLKDQLLNRIAELLPEENAVSRAIAKLDALIEQVEGGNLEERVRGKLTERWPDHESLFEVLLGVTPTDAVANEIVAELTDSIAGRVNERINVLSDEAASKARSIAREIAFGLGLDAGTAAKLDAFLVEPVEAALTELSAEVEKKLKQVNKDAADELTEILAPFSDLSDGIRTAIANVGGTTAAAFAKVKAGIEDVYARYTGFRQKVIAVVNDRISEQAAFSILSETNRSRVDTTVLAFRIVDARAEGVADLYAAVWSRRLDAIWALLPRLTASEGIANLEGTYVSILRNQQRITLSLNLFGLKLGHEVLFNNEVTVGIDHEGKLIVARTKAEYQSTRKRLRETQRLAAEWSIDYLDTEPGLAPPIKITVDVIDERLTREDLEDFCSGLVTLECVKPGTADAVTDALFGDLNSPKKLHDVTLSVVVTLTWDMFLALLGADRDGFERADRWDGFEVAGELYAAAERVLPEGHVARLRMDAARQNLEVLALLLEIGRHESAKKLKEQVGQWAATHYSIGRPLFMLDRNLDELQEKWLALMNEPRTSGADADLATRFQEQISDIDVELRLVLAALFLRMKVKDPSKSWQAAAGARVLLDRTGREHLMVAVESPLLGRQIFG